MKSGSLEEGMAHYTACRWDEAGAALERAAREQPDHAASWYYLGNVRTEQSRDADAAECFTRALALDASHAKAWNNLGAACQRLGRQAEAAAAYERALQADATLLEPYLNLGRLAESRGDPAAAAVYLRAGLERHPAHPMLVHLLAASTGSGAARAPREHVVAYFDDFAPRFDEHLLGSLDYTVPAELAALLRPRLPAQARVLDLGCGTGLMGAALARDGIELHGIDLSAQMLKRAEARGLYKALQLADVNEGLARAAAASFDAVVAADVFIYIGDLAATFADIARALAPGGLLGFSVESAEEGSFALLPSGRYAHALSYLRRLAVENAFVVRAVQPAALRRHQAGFVDGQLLLLERL